MQVLHISGGGLRERERERQEDLKIDLHCLLLGFWPPPSRSAWCGPPLPVWGHLVLRGSASGVCTCWRDLQGKKWYHVSLIQYHDNRVSKHVKKIQLGYKSVCMFKRFVREDIIQCEPDTVMIFSVYSIHFFVYLHFQFPTVSLRINMYWLKFTLG